MFCYASSAVNGGAKAGITTCSLSTDFIISVPDGADNEWKVSMYPTLKTYFFSDLFGFHDQYETLFDDAAESWILDYEKNILGDEQAYRFICGYLAYR